MKKKIYDRKTILSGIMILGFLLIPLLLSFNVSYADFSVNSSAASGITKLNNILYKLVEGAGDILLILGVWKFGTGFSSDSAKDISAGISALILGGALANIRGFMG